MWGTLFKKKTPKVSGIGIVFLQRPMDHFSTERLNEAMQKGWRKKYDEQKFYAVSIFDDEGAVIKFKNLYFTILHVDRWLDSKELGDHALPVWAIHGGHSRLEYKCPGGIPPGEVRWKMYGFMGLLCAKLLTPQTVGLFFTEERVLVQITPDLCNQLRSGRPLNPVTLLNELN